MYMATAQHTSVSRSNSFYACYCCSHCANPVVARLTINSSQNGRIGFFGTTLEELQTQVSTEHAENTDKLLAYLASPRPETFPEEKVEGMDSPCPICGNVEPWQTKELLWKLVDAGTVLVMPDLHAGYAWAQQVLRERRSAALNADTAALQRAEDRLRAIGEELSACEQEKSSGAAAQELASIRAKEGALNDQFKSLSAFSKEKKQAKDELDRCRAALDEAQTRYNTAVAREDAKIAALTVEQAPLLLFGKPLPERATLHENKYSLALAIAATGEDAGRSVSLAPLPQTGKHSVSDFETKNRELLLQTIQPLNDLLLKGEGKETEV